MSQLLVAFAVGAAAAEPFLRLKTSGVSVVPWLGLGLVTKFTGHRSSGALDVAITVHPRNATFVMVDVARRLPSGLPSTRPKLESKTPKDLVKALVLRTS